MKWKMNYHNKITMCLIVLTLFIISVILVTIQLTTIEKMAQKDELIFSISILVTMITFFIFPMMIESTIKSLVYSSNILGTLPEVKALKEKEESK